jgi:hypothetical protein
MDSSGFNKPRSYLHGVSIRLPPPRSRLEKEKRLYRDGGKFMIRNDEPAHEHHLSKYENMENDPCEVLNVLNEYPDIVQELSSSVEKLIAEPRINR